VSNRTENRATPVILDRHGCRFDRNLRAVQPDDGLFDQLNAPAFPEWRTDTANAITLLRLHKLPHGSPDQRGGTRRADEAHTRRIDVPAAPVHVVEYNRVGLEVYELMV